MTLKANIPDDIRRQANEILKGVDQHIKAGKLEEALKELSRAKAIDPNNGYIYAFAERIAFLKEEAVRKKGAEQTRAQMEEVARRKLDEERKRIEEERRRKEEENVRRHEEERRRRVEEVQRRDEENRRRAEVEAAAATEQMSTAAVERQRIEEEARRKFEEEVRRTEEENRRKAMPPPPPQPAPAPAKAPVEEVQRPRPAPSQAGAEALMMYKRVLLLAWADGALSQEEEEQLRQLRSAFEIAPEDHDRLEQEARLESYSHAYKLAWSSGLNPKERTTVVAELRKKFQLAQSLITRTESQILDELGITHREQVIYVIDDEVDFLKIVVRVLESAGYVVKAFNTSDEAFSNLKEDTPDLVLSDINLETSSLGGFSFYEKVRQLEHLVNVPFLFLSGMTDEGMIRYGKALGADDYLTKPFSNDLLLDTIKGKLKRYRQIRNH